VFLYAERQQSSRQRISKHPLTTVHDSPNGYAKPHSARRSGFGAIKVVWPLDCVTVAPSAIGGFDRFGRLLENDADEVARITYIIFLSPGPRGPELEDGSVKLDRIGCPMQGPLDAWALGIISATPRS
jgi:hypothetical protein